MARIDPQLAGERTAQGFVGGDERAQSLVDLAVFALAAALEGLHENQPDTYGDERDEHHSKQSGRQGPPGTEIEIAAHGGSDALLFI